MQVEFGQPGTFWKKQQLYTVLIIIWLWMYILCGFFATNDCHYQINPKNECTTQQSQQRVCFEW